MRVNTGQHTRLWRLLWLVCMAAVITGSLLPGDTSPMRAIDRLDVNDRVQHCLAYAVLALLPALHEKQRTLASLLLLSAAVGVLLEFGQMYSPGRTFDKYDIVADLTGLVAGALVGLSLRPLRRLT